ncbi:MAG: HAMP domain-containing sensor histidine kinase [Candidatus Sulfopaludibacter sp.]|nr:HAMP domain-containing sensor histidine kinase [Candidatus Sulfopaludibacter sp.]
MRWRPLNGAGYGDGSAWLLLLFVLMGVLAPGAAVVWFMNAAARSEGVAAGQSVAEAYRGQLRLLRDQVDEWWKDRASSLDGAGDPRTALAAGAADAVLLLDRKGALVYPAPAPTPRPDLPSWWPAQMLEQGRDRPAETAAAYAMMAKSEPDVSLAARAAEGQVRWLLRSGAKEAAIAAIQRYFTAGRLARAADRDGRSIAANELLLAVHLLQHGDPRRAPLAVRLAALLNDYNAPMIPSGQRLFLMDQLRSEAPELPPFATYSAERLAAQFLDTESPRPGDPVLEPAGPRDLWKLTSPDRRAIALYRTGTVASLLAKLLDERKPSKNARSVVTPPGRPATGDAIAAGAMLPGWQISFSLVDPLAAQESARRRKAAYLWTGYLVLTALAATGLITGQSFRRQLRLTRLKTDLVAAVSHELKTPLASMRLLVETLLADERFDASKTREYLELIAGENLRLSRLIDNFLTFSRIERNRQNFEFRPSLPSRVVETALLAMRERLRAPGCDLEVSVAADLPPIQADEDALVTVLLNLLENAYKYTRSNKRIILRAYRENGSLIFAVQDNGIGIAPRDQKRIFRRFYQVDRRLAREAGGCGLGLSIVEFIVRAHGGAVKVESRPGSGSTFSVLLPCQGASREAVA